MSKATIKNVFIPVSFKERGIVSAKCPYYKWSKKKKLVVVDSSIKRNREGLLKLFEEHPEFLTKRNKVAMNNGYNDIKRRARMRKVQREYNSTFGIKEAQFKYVEKYLKYPLFQHQRKALWLSTLGDTYPLFMKQGTGKTLVAIANILHRHIQEQKFLFLVVAPKIVTYEWEEQLHEHLEKYTCDIVIANRGFDDLKDQLTVIRKDKDKKKLRIVVANYESLDRAATESIFKDFDMIILDESQRIKNIKSNTSFAALKIAKHIPLRLIMTGTPITNHNVDLYTQFNFLDYDIINKDYDTFQYVFCRLGPYGIVGNRNEKLLKKIMHNNAYIVNKEDVLNLPPQIHRVMKLENANEVMYKKANKELIIELKDKTIELDYITTKLEKVQQICSGFIYDEDENGKRIVKKLKKPKKIEAVKTLLTENYKDDKVIIVTKYIEEVEDLQKLLNKLKLNHVAITGDDENDEKAVKRFKKDPKCKVLISNGKRIARGLTFTSSRVMIFYGMTFDWEVYDQVISRIHRIGQNSTCEYIYLVTEKTREEQIHKSVVIDKTDAIEYMMKK